MCTTHLKCTENVPKCFLKVIEKVNTKNWKILKVDLNENENKHNGFEHENF